MDSKEFTAKFVELDRQITKNEIFFFNTLPSWQFSAIMEVANRMGGLAGTPSYNAISKAAHGDTAENITEPHARKWLDDVIALIENRPAGMPGDYTRA